jgi:hypothetical protein
MLDDLTRPAPPAVVTRVPDPGGVRVRTSRPTDPRVVGRVVFRIRDNDPPVLVCSGRAACIVPRATVPGTYRFEAEYVDAWGRTSAPTFSAPWTFHQP